MKHMIQLCGLIDIKCNLVEHQLMIKVLIWGGSVEYLEVIWVTIFAHGIIQNMAHVKDVFIFLHRNLSHQ